MAPPRTPDFSRGNDDTVPTQPQSSPLSVGMPTADRTFMAVMEINTNLSMLVERVEHLKVAVEKSDQKLDALRPLPERVDALKESVASLKGEVKDITSWKNRLLGGGAVMVTTAVATVAIMKFLGVPTLDASTAKTTSVAIPAPPPAEPAAPASKRH